LAFFEMVARGARENTWSVRDGTIENKAFSAE
jgi:hypothetical protein